MSKSVKERVCVSKNVTERESVCDVPNDTVYLNEYGCVYIVTKSKRSLGIAVPWR